MHGWKARSSRRNGPSWSVSRDQQLQTCERKYYFQYLAGARVNAADPMQKRLGMLKKLKNIRMWEGECLHWAIARFLGAVRDKHGVSAEQVLVELKAKMEREWQFSEQRRICAQPTIIYKGGLGLVEHAYERAAPHVTPSGNYRRTTNHVG